MTQSCQPDKTFQSPIATPDLQLLRYGYTPLGTFGEMKMPDGQTLYTVERPWVDNKPNVSCIPPLIYECGPRMFHRGGYMAVEIKNVPGRDDELIHIANKPDELLGCIAIVSKLGVVDGVWGGLSSKIAFDIFMDHYGGKTFRLNITEFHVQFPKEG